MGKKTRKTRWRTLAIADESDSEESNTLSGSQLSKSYHHRPFYSKFTHSSQSTPTRRFPYEPKSTRSSSTASETKITFNEDEYTKITTPRQDVLFKKGYLSKPKNYQTQTSTGNSTASTGNSTGNGTPDHQSADGTEGTDLEYESQFVFPNAFVDQNGIYYINSYEHYPMVLYNPPICYPEYPTSRTKRHSTGSLTESTSPHTEETSQDLSQSGGENTGNGPEFNHVYNIIYPGYYFNGVCNSNVTTNGQAATEPRKIKKKRRRKISKSINQEDTTSSEDGYSSDEAITQVENRIQGTAPHIPDSKTCPKLDGHSIAKNIESETNVILVDEREKLDDTTKENNDGNCEDHNNVLSSQTEDNSSSKRIENESDSISNENHLAQKEIPEKSIEENNEKHAGEVSHEDETETTKDEKDDEGLNTNTKSHENSQESISKSEDVQEVIHQHSSDNAMQPIHESKFNLNAQEFVPRAYRNVEAVSVDPNLQFINIHPNFVPLPLINHHINELNHPHPPHFNQPFLPPGIPLNFVTADPKLLPNFVNLLPNNFVPPKPYEQSTSSTPSKIKDSAERDEQLETKNDEIKSTEAVETKKEMEKQDISDEKPSDAEKPKPVIYKNDVDIAKIVSKLEEAAKEQKLYENRRQEYRSPNKFNKVKPKFNSSYQSQDAPRSNIDKRRFRRFDNKSSENTESKLKQTTVTLTEESLNSQERFLQKSESQTEPQRKAETREITAKPNGDEIKYSPRHNPFKTQESPRRYTNYNRNTRNRSPDRNYTTPTNDYSNTLKKSYKKSYSKYDKYASEKINMATKQTPKTKTEESIQDVKTKTLTAPNQWISVSNRKKRKNKTANDDDIDDAKDGATELNSEVFEISNDSKPQEMQLEDIILAETLTESEKKDSSIQIDTFIEMVSKSESTPIKICPKTEGTTAQIVLQDIQDIELELLKESVKIIEAAKDEIVINIPKTEEVDEPLPRVQSKTQKETSKKKKKGVGKNSTKRIIILDPDVSKKEPQEKDIPKAKLDTEKLPSEEEEQDETVKLTEDLSVDILTDTSSIQKEDGSKNNGLTAMEKSTEIIQTPDKKKNKKKKKQGKPPLITSISSVSSSSTTLNNVDDSYDFLLDTTALVEEKTNVEVSEELDKMIQRGLFGNLEEKFKSLNVSVDDDFFKSLTLKSKPQSTPEKGFIKATNFTTILNHANQPAPKVTMTDEQDKIDIDFSKIKLPDCEPQPSTSKMGIFLEKPPPNETGPPEEAEVKLSSKSNGKLKNKSKKRLSDIDLEAELSNKTVWQEEAKYFANNHAENDNMTITQTNVCGESSSTDFFQENKENKTNLEDEPMKVIEENIVTISVEDAIAHCDISDTSNDICQNTHSKLKTEIPPAELVNGYKSDDALDIEVMVREEIENDTLNEAVDQEKNLQEKRIVIKIEKVESVEDLSLESALTKTDDYLTDGEYPKTFSDTSSNTKPLYPITQAVREWMTKTRETTPEIEILKSPDTIYKEFIEYSEGEDCASDKETDQKNGMSNPAFIEYPDQNEICHISMNARVANSNSDNDTTVCETWSMSQDTSIQEEDLLDCWEPDIMETKKEEVSRKNEPIEEAEDVLQVYESKYGKNEDFLRLKAEIEEHKRNGTFPKHSNLPYRAICCSLM